MRTLSTLLFASLAFLSACSGGAATHESVAKEGTQLMNDFVTTLESISDKKTAEAAKPKLVAIEKSMEELKKKAEALGKASPEVEAKLTEQGKAQQADIMRRMMAWSMKMGQNPEAMEPVKDVLEKMGKNAGR